MNGNQPLSTNGSNIFQVRLFGNVLCNSTNQTQLEEIQQLLATTLADYCGCAKLVTESNQITLLCNTDPNWFVFRVTLEENVATMFWSLAEKWMKSPSPHIILDSQALLVDSTCPIFIETADSSSCITAAPQLAGVVTGTFFGALILGILLTVAVLAVAVLILWMFKREKPSTFFSPKDATLTSIKEEKNVEEEYETMDMETHGPIEQSNDHYEYPLAWAGKEGPVKNKTTTVEIDDGYENPHELASLSSKERSAKKNQNWKKKKEPQVATYNSVPMVTMSSHIPLDTTQPPPTNVTHKQENAVKNDCTTKKECSPVTVTATVQGSSSHGSTKGTLYEPLTLEVSTSAPISPQHLHQTKQQKKKPKANLQSQHQTQEAVVQPSPVLSQSLTAVALSSTAVQQPLMSENQPAPVAIAQPSPKQEQKDAQRNLQVPSEASKTNQMSATMAELKGTSPVPRQGQKKPMLPRKKHENVTFEADQVKTEKKAKVAARSTSDQAHTRTGHGTKEEQASTNSLKQPSAFQAKTGNTPPSPEVTKSGKKKNFQR